MELKPQEKILKAYHRHVLPYIWLLLKTTLISLPFYLLAYILYQVWPEIGIFGLFIISLGLVLLLLYVSSIYWLDKLVVTNERVIFVNWKNLLLRIEESSELSDIQDIQTHEFGLLSNFKIFDFGIIEIRTASAKAVITFDQAPNPEGIKQHIENLQNKDVLKMTEKNREHQDIKPPAGALVEENEFRVKG